MVDMSAETGGGKSPSEYIVHHLTHYSAGHGFWAVHVDTLAVSAGLGLVFLLIFGLAARRATAGVPGRFQSVIELVVEFVDNQVADAVHGSRAFLGPLALTIFCWIFLMNFIDL